MSCALSNKVITYKLPGSHTDWNPPSISSISVRRGSGAGSFLHQKLRLIFSYNFSTAEECREILLLEF